MSDILVEASFHVWSISTPIHLSFPVLAAHLTTYHELLVGFSNDGRFGLMYDQPPPVFETSTIAS